jgi:hypothetical protein
MERAIKLWMSLRTLHRTNPLSRFGSRVFRRFRSPLQEIGQKQLVALAGRLEIIQAYVIAPWLPVIIEPEDRYAALLALSHPRQQSGLGSIREVYEVAHALRKRGNRIRLVWIP